MINQLEAVGDSALPQLENLAAGKDKVYQSNDAMAAKKNRLTTAKSFCASEIPNSHAESLKPKHEEICNLRNCTEHGLSSPGEGIQGVVEQNNT